MSNGDPLISIVIPVFNDAEYLPRALESCIQQTHGDIEIIVVDDASTDKTPKIVARYAKKDKRIKSIHHDENKKTLQAIKTGVLAARGEYIMVVSGDDAFDTNAVEICERVIRKNQDVDILHFGRRVIDIEGIVSQELTPAPTMRQGEEILDTIFNFVNGSQGSFSNKCWNRRLLEGVFNQVEPSKPLVLGEDQVVVFLAALRAKKYIAIPDIIHNYYFGIGMDGKVNIDLEYFLDYRLSMADSMDELEKQLREMKVKDWAWNHFRALKREHYAWSACVAEQLNESDKFEALKAWTERTNPEDTLIGIANYIPNRFLDEYMAFLEQYRPNGFDMKAYHEIIASIIDMSSMRMNSLKDELSDVKEENDRLRTELESYFGIKRSAKMTLGNIRRRLKQ